jgi:hypothetical protein
MSQQVTYCQLNKDYAYWTEKRRIGQIKGGHVAGLFSHRAEGRAIQNILIDAGLGTLEALADLREDGFWDEPLVVYITHGHIDHHAELMILSEIYCKRRGQHIHDVRPPLKVFCTRETHKHLERTHWYGFHGGDTLTVSLIQPNQKQRSGIFEVLPLAVDHFEGAVIFVVQFDLSKTHKIIIGWDMTSPPLNQTPHLRNPSLALFEATTFTPLAPDTGHTSIEELVNSRFLEQLQLQYLPEKANYGAHLVHYSGWEDPWGMLTDTQLKAKFDALCPSLSDVVRVAKRGQIWEFN